MIQTTYRWVVLSIASLIAHVGQSVAQTDKADSVEFNLGKEIAKVFDTKVLMDVDTTFFTSHMNNFYMAEERKAMIMTMVVPQTFNKAEEHFNRESQKKDFKLIDKGKLQHNGKSILYQKGMVKRDGKKAFIHMYAVEGNEESTIFITGMFMPGDEKIVPPKIERAAFTARLAGK